MSIYIHELVSLSTNFTSPLLETCNLEQCFGNLILVASLIFQPNCKIDKFQSISGYNLQSNLFASTLVLFKILQTAKVRQILSKFATSNDQADYSIRHEVWWHFVEGSHLQLWLPDIQIGEMIVDSTWKELLEELWGNPVNSRFNLKHNQDKSTVKPLLVVVGPYLLNLIQFSNMVTKIKVLKHKTSLRVDEGFIQCSGMCSLNGPIT